MTRAHVIAMACGGLVMLMTGAAFAAVPLYDLFCRVTGFGGTTMVADKPSEVVLDETIRVRFDTNVRNLPVRFKSRQRVQTVRIGETGMAYFEVTNTSDVPVSAVANYNVVPDRAGPYFQKLQCFCFDEQIIPAGETMVFPIQYFIAPELATDREGRGVTEITLSYTFYPSRDFDPSTGAAKSGATGS